MDRYYIYKLTFMNGCTYVGKHHQIKENDKYVTSSSYYWNKGGKDILLKREILLDNLPDNDICEIMETICILHDRAENVNNVNYNKGAWVSSHFDRGFSGKDNGMYGKSLKSIMGDDEYEAFLIRRREAQRNKMKPFRDAHNGMTPHEWEAYQKKQKNKIKMEERHRKYVEEYNSHFHANNEKELKEWRSKRSSSSRWYHDSETRKETFCKECPEGWVKGRLPHSLWSEERKKSYAEKHSFNPTERMDEISINERSRKLSDSSKGRVCYTNGEKNVYLRPGQDIPEGFYKGCTFTKTELYLSTRFGRKRKDGRKNSK